MIQCLNDLMTQSNGSIIETAQHVALLLDVLHRHKRTVVVAGGLDGARHHSSESFAKFGILRYQCLDQGRILLKRARGIRYVGGLVLYYQVKIVADAQRKDFGQVVDLAAGAYIHGVSVRRHIGGSRCLGLVVELVRGERAHKVHWGGQGDRLAVIQPGVVILCFGLEIAGVLGEPCGIVSRGLRGSGEKTRQLPVRACLLQDQGQRHGSLAAVHVENGDAVFAGRKIRQDKYRAVLRLTRLTKYPTQKFGACERFWAIGGQQERRPNRDLCTGERSLILFDRAFNSGAAGGHGGNGVLLQAHRIAARRHFEVALRRGFERGSHGEVRVRGVLAGLGVDRNSERWSQQKQPQPSSAGPSIRERWFRSRAQGEPPPRHFTPRKAPEAPFHSPHKWLWSLVRLPMRKNKAA